MNNRFAGALVVLFLVAAMPAAGGLVSISGNAIVFEAGPDQVNTLLINPNGGGFDQSTGEVVNGISISDNTSSLVVKAPCRVLTGVAVCPAAGIDVSSAARTVTCGAIRASTTATTLRIVFFICNLLFI